MSERIRPSFVSEVAFSQDGQPRPIHIFRAGTFTSMDGREYTYTPEHIRSMLDNFAAGKRKRPPITEKHDWGRAVGRITKLWADAACENLYALPVWNKAGRELLTEETYDGFSSEIEHIDDGRILIGGSLTNYPAVDGLEPVTLSAPPIDDNPAVSLPNHAEIEEETRGVQSPSLLASAPLAAGGLREENTTTTRKDIFTMDEDTTVVETPPTLPPLPPINDTAMQAQIGAYVQQMEARYQAQQEAAFQRAQVEFERRIADMEARRQIETYAQHATTATLQRQHALPIEAEALTSFLASLSASQRATAQTLFTRILEAGLVSFEEIGSQGEAAPEQSAKEQFDAAVQEKVRGGMSQLSAIQAVGKEQPDLYASYQAESSKRGRVQVARGGK
jgi:hypothetical protein